MEELGSRKKPNQVGESSAAATAVEGCGETRDAKFDEAGQETPTCVRHRLEQEEERVAVFARPARPCPVRKGGAEQGQSGRDEAAGADGEPLDGMCGQLEPHHRLLPGQVAGHSCAQGVQRRTYG